MWNLENDKNESIYKAETDSQMQKQIVTKRKKYVGRINQEYGIKRYKQLYIKQISNRIYCKIQGTIFNIL